MSLSDEVNKSLTIDQIHKYCLHFTTNELGFDMGNQEEYFIEIAAISRFDESLYSCFLLFYDDENEILNAISIDYSINLMPLSLFQNKNYCLNGIYSFPYTKELWDKEKKIRKQMGDWFTPLKNNSLWDFKQKYDFYLENGGFIAPELYDQINGIGIEKPIGQLAVPETGEMDYDKAMEYAWKIFEKYSNKAIDHPEKLIIDSMCIRHTSEWIHKAGKSISDGQMDGVDWYIKFYDPIIMDNGETIYKLIFDTGRINESAPLIKEINEKEYELSLMPENKQ